MPLPDQYEDSEGWGAYRKLIVETLRRLDEYVSDLKSEIDSQRTRIQILEGRTNDTRIEKGERKVERIEEVLEKIDLRLDKLEAAKQITEATGKSAFDLVKTVGGAAWGIIVIIIATWINVKFFH